MQPPPPELPPFKLYRLAPLAQATAALATQFSSAHTAHNRPLAPPQASATSILHAACSSSHLALATSGNTLILVASATATQPPLARQLRWFTPSLKRVAAMDLSSSRGLLVASHDASVFVVPLGHLLRRPPTAVAPRPADDGALELPGGLVLRTALDDADKAAEIADAAELRAVYAAARGRAAGVSACAWWARRA